MLLCFVVNSISIALITFAAGHVLNHYLIPNYPEHNELKVILSNYEFFVWTIPAIIFTIPLMLSGILTILHRPPSNRIYIMALANVFVWIPLLLLVLTFSMNSFTFAPLFPFCMTLFSLTTTLFAHE